MARSNLGAYLDLVEITDEVISSEMNQMISCWLQVVSSVGEG